MIGMEEPDESLAQRTKRALQDNGPQAQAAGGSAMYSELIEQRLRAIRQVHDLEPKRACFSNQVQALSRSLVDMSGDSVHYRAQLDKLREAHEEWIRLETRLWAARYDIASTQWLIEVLSAPKPVTTDKETDEDL